MKLPHHPPLRCLLLPALAFAVFACDGDTSAGVAQDGRDGASLDAADTSDTAAPPDAVDVLDTVDALDTAPDLADTTPDPVDTAPEADTTPDVADTNPADTAPEDTTPDVADTTADTAPDTQEEVVDTCPAECPVVDQGPTGVAITLQPRTVAAPDLKGLIDASSAPSGRFELKSIDVYQKDTVSSFVGLTITNKGDTAGATVIEPDVWALRLLLDLQVDVNAIGQNFGTSNRSELLGGGCYTIADALIESDLSHCAASWPEGAEVPDRAEFEYDQPTGKLALKIELSKDFLLSFVPPEYAGLAGFAITGPLRLVLKFEAAP